MIKRFCAHPSCGLLVEKGQRYCTRHSRKLVYCNYPSCNRKVSVLEGYCEEHNPRKAADAKRGSSNSRGYDGRWFRLSRLYLINHPVCERCNKAPATLVHHKIPIRDGGQTYDPDNLMSVCATCHGRLHSEISARKHSNEIRP